VWLAPIQARIITVADRHMDWARAVHAQLQLRGFRVELDESSEKLGAKIRDAQLMKVPYTLVIGDKEVEGKGVSPRKHGEGKDADLGFHALDAFAAKLSSEAASPY
jgi:threonyl-tRNA synthetase